MARRDFPNARPTDPPMPRFSCFIGASSNISSIFDRSSSAKSTQRLSLNTVPASCTWTVLTLGQRTNMVFFCFLYTTADLTTPGERAGEVEVPGLKAHGDFPLNINEGGRGGGGGGIPPDTCFNPAAAPFSISSGSGGGGGGPPFIMGGGGGGGAFFDIGATPFIGGGGGGGAEELMGGSMEPGGGGGGGADELIGGNIPFIPGGGGGGGGAVELIGGKF